ncbi:MAG: SRPBCC family protein [Nevskiales bacterium]
MASIRKEFLVEAGADQVWSAVRDFGAVHQRLAPGFVVDAQLDGDARVVTFGNGMVARERLIDLNDETRRLVYSVVGGRFTHDNSSVQIFAEGEQRCRFVWTRDMLPNELAGPVDAMMTQATGVMKKTLEAGVGARAA